ncbi:ADP-ribosylglycohydrolase family protein [Sphingobium sp. EP60837]|uniref:ADP-ribosylglycohydrolase family protein n=1 Tax=Sphingobium sp. EP60837 TaxID=1855519 RepID=UPI0007DD4013|nr:ADP-ribosylglycohydrolase family protein [Sphingobium sp. EP60837]ANI78126.1 ADP-ribosyl-[dinitrogen reductase] hydrolase [Sphingobium sp. EP60837]
MEQRDAAHTPRTSSSHPLQIAFVPTRDNGGRIGITFCPGKKQHDALTGAWDRDLRVDLDAIQASGAAAIVSLIEPSEFQSLGVDRLGEEVRARHMDWFHLPIADVSIPGPLFEQEWTTIGANLRSRLRQGFDIVVHCKGGLGRAGMIAACLLVELGTEPKAAIGQVRMARPGAIETHEQLTYVQQKVAVAEASPAQTLAATRDRGRGALIGLAVGDALGTTLEFARRDSYPVLIDMIGGGPFGLKPGEWTDDTSMALALADSLISCNGIDEADLMKRFVAWRDEGAYSSNGHCFDIGMTVSAALAHWERTGNPIAGSTDPSTAGNGSLMRLAPIALRYHDDTPSLAETAARQSRVTHGAPEAVDACVIYARMIAIAICGSSLDDVLSIHTDSVTGKIAHIVGGSWRGKPRRDIRASGYVAHSLEAALWCIGRTGNFAEAVLTAANLGEDADTTAAITGQLAGALYGENGIPEAWRNRIVGYERIGAMADQLLSR